MEADKVITVELGTPLQPVDGQELSIGVFLDSCGGESMLGCIDSSCPVSFEPEIFEIKLRAHEDIFSYYSNRVEVTSTYFENEQFSIELKKSFLQFEVCILLNAVSIDGNSDQTKEYKTKLHLEMTETITTPTEEESVEPDEGNGSTDTDSE